MYEEYHVTGQGLIDDLKEIIENAHLDPSKHFNKRRRLGEKVTREEIETIFDNREY